MAEAWVLDYTAQVAQASQLGHPMPSRYGDTRELLDLHITTSPVVRPIRLGLNSKIGWCEVTQLLAGEYHPEYIQQVAPNANMSLFTESMAYGPRVAWQIPQTITALKNDMFTRQAVIFVGSAQDGPTSNQPCTSTIQFLYRHGRIRTYVRMRSWDLIKGLPYDLMMFGSLAQVIGLCVGIPAGPLDVTAASGHIYTSDLERGRFPNGQYRRYIWDLPGNWEQVQSIMRAQQDPALWAGDKPHNVMEVDYEPDHSRMVSGVFSVL